jgi:hypothetical protein
MIALIRLEVSREVQAAKRPMREKAARVDKRFRIAII